MSDVKMTATFVKSIESFTGRAELFRFEPPLVSRAWDNEPTRPVPYAVVSACVVPYISRPETYLFEANESGEVLSWSDLEGSQNGTTDIDAVLAEAGYEVVRAS